MILNANRIKDFFKSDKGIKAAIIIGAVLVCGVFFFDLIVPDNAESSASVTQTSENPYEYEKKLENRLYGILSKIDGVGELEIMLTIDSTSEYVFAEQGSEKRTESETYSESTITEANTNIDSSNEYILVEGQSGRKEALLKTVVQPKVRGVTVVCGGGDSVYVREKVVNAVSKLFGISSAKVYVTK